MKNDFSLYAEECVKSNMGIWVQKHWSANNGILFYIHYPTWIAVEVILFFVFVEELYDTGH